MIGLYREPDSGQSFPDAKVHGANMGPIWVLSDPDGPHVGPMNLVIRATLPGYLQPYERL